MKTKDKIKEFILLFFQLNFKLNFYSFYNGNLLLITF